MKLKIQNKQLIAQDILQIDFDTSETDFSFQPGQFVRIDFAGATEELQKMPHYFSIASSPNNKNFFSIATFLRSTPFKQMIKKLPIGAEMEVGQPAGNFLLPKFFNQPLVFIAGGIGITPFISMLKLIKEEKLPFKITVVYSVKTLERAAYLNKLEEYEKDATNFMKTVVTTGDENHVGSKTRINTDLIKTKVPDLDQSLFYLAGSVGFVNSMIEILLSLEVLRSQIKTDSFSGY